MSLVIPLFEELYVTMKSQTSSRMSGRKREFGDTFISRALRHNEKSHLMQGVACQPFGKWEMVQLSCHVTSLEREEVQHRS